MTFLLGLIYTFVPSKLELFYRHSLVGLRGQFSLSDIGQEKGWILHWSTWPTHSHSRYWSLFSKMSVRPQLFKISQNKKLFTRVATGRTVVLAKWIMDDTSLMFYSFRMLWKIEQKGFPRTALAPGRESCQSTARFCEVLWSIYLFNILKYFLKS